MTACETHPFVPLTYGDFASFGVYAPDACYFMAASTKADYVNSDLFSYNPDTNALDLIETVDASNSGPMVYHSGIKKILMWRNGLIGEFDPFTETFSAYPATTDNFFNAIYVPEKDKIYGTAGYDGTGHQQVGYIDTDLQLIVPLGSIPASGPTPVPSPYNWTYSPISDKLYGPWISGLGSAIVEFDLATNTATHKSGNAIACVWDSDRDLLITFGSLVKEYDVSGGGFVEVYSGPIDPDDDPIGWLQGDPCYVPSLGKVVAYGDKPSGDQAIFTYDPITRSCEIIEEDVYYTGLYHLSEGGFIACGRTLVPAELPEGFRRICAS